MRAAQVVVLEEAVEVGLELGGVVLPGLSACDAEGLVEERSIRPFDEAVGPGRAGA